MADPSTISGKRLWLRAKDNAGANGSTVTSWTDQSGLGNNATGVSTPTVATSSTPNGGKSVAFANAGYFTLPNIMSGATEGEAWVVIKETTAVTQTAFWQMGTDTQESHYPYSGSVYEAFGIGPGQRVSFTPTLAVDSWRIYRVQSSGGSITAWLDNVRQISATGKTVSWTTAPTLGAGKNSNIVDMKFSGNIAEIVVLDRTLNTADAADFTAYFNTEHGLTVASPISVTEVGTAGNITTAGTSGTCSIATAPTTGDKVYVAVDIKTSSNNQTPTSISVSGLSGTWTQKDRQAVTGGSGNVGVAHELWECVGATASGTVTVSWTNNSQGTLRIMTVRGFTGATVVTGSNTQNTAAVTGVFTGPSANALLGQLVIVAQYDGFANTSNGSLFSTVVPSTGWTIGTPLQPGIGGKWNVGYRIPTETSATAHRTDFDNAGFSGGPALITEWTVVPSTVVGAQVESVYAEVLDTVTALAQVESVYAEVLNKPTVTTVQIESLYAEVLADSAVYIPTTTATLPISISMPNVVTPLGNTTTSTWPISIGMDSAIGVTPQAVAWPISAGWSVSAAQYIRITTAELPITVSADSTAGPDWKSYAALSLIIGMDNTSMKTTASTAELPITMGMTSADILASTIFNTWPMTIGMDSRVISQGVITSPFSGEGFLSTLIGRKITSSDIGEGTLVTAMDSRVNFLPASDTGEGTLTSVLSADHTLHATKTGIGTLSSHIVGNTERDVTVWFTGPETEFRPISGPDSPEAVHWSGPFTTPYPISGPEG